MHLSLTTPRGALVDAEVEEVTAPGALGEFGVLAGHVPFLSVLKPGVFVYRTKDGARYLAVGGGVLEVARTADKGDKVLVLVEQAAHARELDREAATKELAALDHEIAHWKKETNTGEYQALLSKRAWAAARVDAASRVAPH